MVFGLLATPAIAADNADEYTVFVSIEGFNLGHGFYVAPTAISVPVGSTAMDATRALFEQTNLEYSPTPWGGIGRIYGIHPGVAPNPPSYITIEMENSPTDGSLGSDDYTPGFSGWMFSINHYSAPVGADDLVLSDRDVIRWQFTVEGWGADLGLGEDRGAFGEPLYTHENKTELIRALFTEGASEDAVEAALAVIINPLATSQDITAALAALTGQDAGGNITVFVSFEGFNLGHGFYIEPMAVNVPEGATAMDATLALLNNAGYEYTLTAWGGLDRIYGFHPGHVYLPVYITLELEPGADDGSVGAFDYSEYSGWMYTINHFSAPVGADGLVVFGGDVIRWQFTVEGWGADLGLGVEWGRFAPGLFEHADKTELIRGLFADEANPDAVQEALSVIIDPLATAEDVTTAFAALELPAVDADKASLGVAIADAATRERETYVPEDAMWDPAFWGVLQTALNAAQVVYANPYATQLAVNGAAQRLLTALDALVPLPPAEPVVTWENPFADVSQEDWFYEYVQFVFTNDLMTGVTPYRFAPETNLSRAMATTMLWRLAGYPDAGLYVFDDIVPGRWYSNAAAWAGANGIMQAYTGDSFAASQSLTTEEFAVIISAYAQFAGLEDVAAYIFAEMALSVNVTRSEAAFILQRLLRLVD